MEIFIVFSYPEEEYSEATYMEGAFTTREKAEEYICSRTEFYPSKEFEIDNINLDEKSPKSLIK